MPKESLCIKVPKAQGDKTLALARRLGISDKSLLVWKDDDSICIPLVHPPTREQEATLRTQLPIFQLETRPFTEKKPHNKTLLEVLEKQLPPHLLASLPKALDMVGDIAIVEILPELKPHEKLLGNAILETHRNVRTVLAKAGAVIGTYRLRNFTVIAGEPKTRTLHKEFGCSYQVDVAKAYFSPRLSHEHERVAQLVQRGETVVDMFAGVGPFAVLIAKTQPAVRVYAVDINPEAIELLQTNIRLNRVENRVFPILGDARKIVEEKLVGVADRVIMNLPENAIGFVDAACKATKQAGGIIHFYAFVRHPDTMENLRTRFVDTVEKAGKHVDTFLLAKTVRETAPYEWQIVLDAKIA